MTEQNPSAVAVIVAAGRGRRAGDGPPKQYRTVGGRSVLTRTLEAFLLHPGIGHVVCAIDPADQDHYDAALAAVADGPTGKLLPPVAGADTRQGSVLSALRALLDLPAATDRICLVHDAARPFVDASLIGRAIVAATDRGAAIPGLPVTDTIKQVDADGSVVTTPDRAALRAVQTPQAFRFEPLYSAHAAAAGQGRTDFTDDGQLMEWAGAAVHVFEGDPGNVKLTHPADFEAAERRLSPDRLLTRVATGFDVHAFTDGDHVWLGGLRVPHDRGVLAHSDGDVVLHALTDAVLGALGDGDIGTHFPPSDPTWKGASSDRFLAHAVGKVRDAGGIIDHLDVTVLCERPRIGEYRDAMRARIAEIAGVPVRAVSIKATTTEKLGFTGRGEGLAAQAAATVRLPDGA